MLNSFISDVPYEGQRLGTIVPGILRDLGDVEHLAAMIAPRKLVIAGGVNGEGHKLSAPAVQNSFQYTKRVYQSTGQPGNLHIVKDDSEFTKIILP